MKKLGMAVIGTGFWGKNHARVYRELPSTELVAICDVDEKEQKILLTSTEQKCTRTAREC